MIIYVRQAQWMFWDSLILFLVGGDIGVYAWLVNWLPAAQYFRRMTP